MKHKLYKGDCLEVMKSIKDKSVDMILCDLPYGTTSRLGLTFCLIFWHNGFPPFRLNRKCFPFF